MPEIEGIGHLVIDDGTRERDSVYIEHEGRMQVGIYYERPARERNDSYGWRIEAGLPESTLTIEFATASRAVLADLDTIRGSGRRVQIMFGFGGVTPSGIHHFYNCLMTRLDFTPVNPQPGVQTLEAIEANTNIRLEFSVSLPVEVWLPAQHVVSTNLEEHGFFADYPTLSDELRRFPSGRGVPELGSIQAKKKAKSRAKKPKALPPPKPLTMLEERFTRIAENLEREDKDGN